MFGINLKNIPRINTTEESKSSFAKLSPAIKYPAKKDPTAPIVNMDAAVSNKRNRLSSDKMSESKGKNSVLVLSRSMPNFLNVISKTIAGGIKNRSVSLGICVNPKIPGKMSVKMCIRDRTAYWAQATHVYQRL